MHEHGIAATLLERVITEATKRGASRVYRVTLRIGELSGVEADLLELAWNSFREGTEADGAALEIISEPIRWCCPECAKDIASGEVLRCPDCDVPARLTGGKEIILERLDLEVDDV